MLNTLGRSIFGYRRHSIHAMVTERLTPSNNMASRLFAVLISSNLHHYSKQR